MEFFFEEKKKREIATTKEKFKKRREISKKKNSKQNGKIKKRMKIVVRWEKTVFAGWIGSLTITVENNLFEFTTIVYITWESLKIYGY